MKAGFEGKFGTHFVESEAVVAMTLEMPEFARECVKHLDKDEQKLFRHAIIGLYAILCEEIEEPEDIAVILGELQKMANETR